MKQGFLALDAVKRTCSDRYRLWCPEDSFHFLLYTQIQPRFLIGRYSALDIYADNFHYKCRALMVVTVTVTMNPLGTMYDATNRKIGFTNGRETRVKFTEM